MENAEHMIQQCGCMSGCPACVGPIEEVGLWGKQTALQLLRSDQQIEVCRRGDSDEHAESTARAPERN